LDGIWCCVLSSLGEYGASKVSNSQFSQDPGVGRIAVGDDGPSGKPTRTDLSGVLSKMLKDDHSFLAKYHHGTSRFPKISTFGVSMKG
jgi:hypothetical protein